MKGVMLEVSREELARRKRTGLDRWDEMWEGVLHKAPAPTYEHQRIVDELVAFFLPLLKRTARGTLRAGINVFREGMKDEDYRIPDLTFIAAGNERIIAPDGTRGGGPDAVVEVRSPGDESYDKLPFFAELGVREVVVIDRDTKLPEVLRLAGRQYLAVAAEREGWVSSQVLGVRFRPVGGPHLVVEDLADPAVAQQI
jgi:Uma2 family endonuclease